MKKTIAYSLLILILFAFNYKAVSYIFHLSDNSIVLSQDLDFEKEKSESEKSDEKDETRDFPEYLFNSKFQAFIIINTTQFGVQSQLLFIESDYSKVVYSPPEKHLI